jgi:hypothetical protein
MAAGLERSSGCYYQCAAAALILEDPHVSDNWQARRNQDGHGGHNTDYLVVIYIYPRPPILAVSTV